MVALLPGFRLQEGNAEVRGYSGSGGNVLIDGTRPASKEETLETILKRIPARLVDHIELVRNSAAAISALICSACSASMSVTFGLKPNVTDKIGRAHV